jgi:argininosuccinate lyase
MDNRDDMPKDTESVMLALDQLSQTIEVMTSVVGRLRTHMRQEAAGATRQRRLRADMRPDRILH